jgi:hypothetical protein
VTHGAEAEFSAPLWHFPGVGIRNNWRQQRLVVHRRKPLISPESIGAGDFDD